MTFRPSTPRPSTFRVATTSRRVVLGADAFGWFVASIAALTVTHAVDATAQGISAPPTTRINGAADAANADVCTPAIRQRPFRRPPSTEVARRDPNAPIVVEADRIDGEHGRNVRAEGSVVLRQGPVTVTGDRLTYDNAKDEARAEGAIRIDRGGDIYQGRDLQLQVSRFEGFVLDPQYFFARTGAGGRAERIDFLGEDRTNLTQADYTSCPRDETGDNKPAWLLKSDRVRLDFNANEGVADGAVLLFYGFPVLAAPVLRFPITDERKSGWLPPSVNLDNKKGLELALPYYWNIAPNHDATLAPTLYTRRGVALGGEYRYLGATHGGTTQLDWLPNDRITGKARYAFEWRHRDLGWNGVRLNAQVERASDDSYWKDFPSHIVTITPRLLTQDLRAERNLTIGPFEGSAYARVQRWQVLQDADVSAQIVSPYERSPQLGWRASRPWQAVGANVSVETELNHFTRPNDGTTVGTALVQGWRAHVLASASRRWGAPGWWIEPGIKLNAATYRTDRLMLDGRTSATRFIPTASLDGGMVFERNTSWFGRPYMQTLEPRVRYVQTPRRQQTNLPNFDAAGTDFNVVSIFGDNAFSGIDRVSDAHQITAGATSRWFEPASGVERLRAGVVQRYVLRDQLLTPDGVPNTRRLSDVLFFGQSALSERWALGGALQYSPEIDRVTRSVLSARYTAGPFRTVSLAYRLTRDASEQIDVGWQWPLFGPGQRTSTFGDLGGESSRGRLNLSRNRSCQGTLYGVGRVNYSRRDSRITDSVVGLEYDSGCWIGRVVVERLSTGRADATNRLLFQIEFVGLSRLGSNPLRVLKDNIPGYMLLRDDTVPLGPPPVYE